MVWRANHYDDPAGYTGMPQLFLCLTGLLFGFTALSIGLGFGEPEPESSRNQVFSAEVDAVFVAI